MELLDRQRDGVVEALVAPRIGRRQLAMDRTHDAPRQARAQVAAVCADFPSEMRDDAVLLTSELVSNAIKHGRGQVRLELEWDVDEVTVQVHDTGTNAITLGAEWDLAADRGRGLQLVAALATAWGVEHRADGAGKLVWFRLRRQR